jgi:hypothetical protein
MRPQRKEPDCHTKALIEALQRFEQGLEYSIFITGNRHTAESHIDAARVFLMGKFPVLASRHMRSVTLGNSLDRKAMGLGFRIDYMTAEEFKGGRGFDRLRGMRGKIIFLDDAMLGHTLTHGEQEELKSIVSYINAKFEVQ